MARAWRIEYGGALYHILSSGNEKQNIVTNDDDRKLFLATAGEMAERFEIDLFVYVLMDNHFLCEASHNTSTFWSRCFLTTNFLMKT